VTVCTTGRNRKEGCVYVFHMIFSGAHGSVIGSGTMLQAGKLAGSTPDETIGFFNCPNPSSRIMALGSTQPLAEISSWGVKGAGP
jgi:hypothetical protein